MKELSPLKVAKNEINDCFAIVNEPTKLYRRVGACVPQSISSCCSFLIEAEEVGVEVAVTAELLIEMADVGVLSVDCVVVDGGGWKGAMDSMQREVMEIGFSNL